MDKEYSLTFNIPLETINKIKLDTGLDVDPVIDLNLTHNGKTYYISEINGNITIKNSSIGLLNGLVHEGSLDIYPHEEI